MILEYIVIAIRHNPGKSDYVWVDCYTNGQPIRYSKQAADKKCASIEKGNAMALYAPRAVLL